MRRRRNQRRTRRRNQRREKKSWRMLWALAEVPVVVAAAEEESLVDEAGGGGGREGCEGGESGRSGNDGGVADIARTIATEVLGGDVASLAVAAAADPVRRIADGEGLELGVFDGTASAAIEQFRGGGGGSCGLLFLQDCAPHEGSL